MSRVTTTGCAELVDSAEVLQLEVQCVFNNLVVCRVRGTRCL